MNSSFRVPFKPAARAPEYQRQQAYPVPGLNANARLSDGAAGIARQTIAAQQDFADQQAKQLDALGKNVTKAAETAYDLYTDYQAGKAREKWNQYRVEEMTLQAKLSGKIGNDAIDPEKGVQASITAWQQEARERLGKDLNGMAKGMFDNAIQQHSAKLTAWGIEKSQAEERTYLNQQDEGSIALDSHAMLTDPMNATTANNSIANIKSRYKALRDRNGWSPEYAQAKMNGQMEQVFGKMVENQINSENITAARDLFNRYGAYLGSNRDTLAHKLEARARAAQAERRIDVQARIRDSVAAWQSGQDAPTAPTRQEVFAAYGAEGGAHIWQGLEDTRQFGADLKTLAALTPEEQAGLLEKRRPQPGEGYAQAATVYARLEKAVQDDQRRRRDDPVSYLITKDPEVKSAFAAWAQSHDAGAARTYTTKLRAAAAARGMAWSETAPALLPESTAKQLAWTITNSENPADVIAQQSAAWGRDWPAVERQLVQGNKLPGGLRVIASGMNREGAGLLAGTFRDPKYLTTAREALGLTDADAKAVRERVRDELEDFTHTLLTQGATATAAEFAESATRLTYAYMQRGFGMKDAAARAAKDVALGRYHINGSYRVPQGVDPDAVAAGAENALVTLTENPARLALPTAKGLSQEFVHTSAATTVRRNGQWVTAPDESGLQLFVHGVPVRDADGRTIALTWEQLQEQAAAAGQVNAPRIAQKILEDYAN